MAGNNDPGRHCLGPDKSRIRLYTTAWRAVLAMATLAICAVTPPSPPPPPAPGHPPRPLGRPAPPAPPPNTPPPAAPKTIPLTVPEPARPPPAAQLRALPGLTAPPPGPLSRYNPRTSLPARRRTRWSDGEWRLP